MYLCWLVLLRRQGTSRFMPTFSSTKTFRSPSAPVAQSPLAIMPCEKHVSKAEWYCYSVRGSLQRLSLDTTSYSSTPILAELLAVDLIMWTTSSIAGMRLGIQTGPQGRFPCVASACMPTMSKGIRCLPLPPLCLVFPRSHTFKTGPKMLG